MSLRRLLTSDVELYTLQITRGQHETCTQQIIIIIDIFKVAQSVKTIARTMHCSGGEIMTRKRNVIQSHTVS